MERLTKRILPTVVAVGAGVMTLAGYLIPMESLEELRAQMVSWASVVAAFALILGFLNVLRVHLTDVFSRKAGWPYNLALLLSAVITLGVTVSGMMLSPIRPLSDWWFNSTILPLQAGATGLIAFSLGLAAFRMLRSRRTGLTLVFAFSAVIVLLGTTPMPGPLGEQLAGLRDWWMGVPMLAGMRGLLLGVALGTVLVGLRVLTGFYQPHSDA